MTTISTYGQVASWIRERILEGTYEPGETLPTHSEIAKELGVSRQTVMAAVRELVQEGRLITDGRRGTRVRERVVFTSDATTFTEWGPRDPTKDAFVAAVTASGRTPDKRFDMRIEPASQPIADRLDIAAKDLVCVRSVLEYVDDQPWNRSTSYYPLDLAQKVGLTTPDDIPGGTVRRLAEHDYREVAWYDETFTRQPDPDEIRELAIPPGTGLLIWIRTAVTDSPNQVIDRCTVKVMPGDRNAVVHRQGAEEAQNIIGESRSRRGLQ